MENIKKVSFGELVNTSDNWKTAVIVFSNDSWSRDYSLDSRSYEISSDNKYFDANMGGNSLYGNALDGSDNFVRLDHYLGTWTIEYCYITEK